VGFVKEMEEIIYVVMMFQKIVYGDQDLDDKVVVSKKVEFFGEAMEHVVGLTIRRRRDG
jgi:hypothetical protein